MANWYLLRNGQPHGPYPEETIRQWLSTGQIGPQESLAREGQALWVPVSLIPEFSPATNLPPGSPPPPPPPGAYGGGYNPAGPYATKDKVTAGLLALLLGGTGAHHFYLGNIGLAVGYLMVWLIGAALTVIWVGWFFVWIPGILAFVEGIIFLTKPDDQFQRNYHNWFCTGF